MIETLYARTVTDGRILTQTITRTDGATVAVAGEINVTAYVSARDTRRVVITLADRVEWSDRRKSAQRPS